MSSVSRTIFSLSTKKMCGGCRDSVFTVVGTRNRTLDSVCRSQVSLGSGLGRLGLLGARLAELSVADQASPAMDDG